MGFTTFYHRLRKTGKVTVMSNICPSSQASPAVTVNTGSTQQERVRDGITVYEQLAKCGSSTIPNPKLPQAKNVTAERRRKTQTPTTSSSEEAGHQSSSQTPQPIYHVYVVKQEMILQQQQPMLTERDKVIAIYATSRDANLKVCSMAEQRKGRVGSLEGYDAVEDHEGFLSWSEFIPSSADNGLYVYIDKMEVRPPGSEPGSG